MLTIPQFKNKQTNKTEQKNAKQLFSLSEDYILSLQSRNPTEAG